MNYDKLYTWKIYLNFSGHINFSVSIFSSLFLRLFLPPFWFSRNACRKQISVVDVDIYVTIGLSQCVYEYMILYLNPFFLPPLLQSFRSLFLTVFLSFFPCFFSFLFLVFLLYIFLYFIHLYYSFSSIFSFIFSSFLSFFN